MARSSSFSFAANVALTTCSAEDLVVLKAFANRVQDWLDIEGIVERQGRALDQDQSSRWPRVQNEKLPFGGVTQRIEPYASSPPPIEGGTTPARRLTAGA